MPESSRQCESMHISVRNSRRSLLCAECHKRFQTIQELCLHLDVCIIESFENEAISVFSSMPSLTEPTSAILTATTHAGITAKGDDPPILVPETNVSVGTSQSANLSLLAKCKSECLQVQKTEVTGTSKATTPISLISLPESEQRFWSSSGRPYKIPFEMENTRMLESPSGLKIYVSIEKQFGRGSDGSVCRNNGCSGLQGTHGPNVTSSKRKIIGALANADDDDTYRPKMKCPTCGLVLYRHNFGTHYRIHTGELPFVCTYCQKRFRTTSALKVHIRAHTGEKPYSCSKCSYCCITKRNLDRHIINNHVREGERRGPRERRSRYRKDEYRVIIDDVEIGTTQESEKVDHRYVISPSEMEKRNLKRKTDDGMGATDDNEQSVEMPVLPLLVL